MNIATTCSTATELPMRDGKFANSEVVTKTTMRDFLTISWAYLTADREEAEPKKPIPVQSITTEQLNDESEDVVYRLGHSTVLMKLDGQWILTDPVFSDRASPVQWMGPKRFHDTPISLSELPFIDVVLISHDHYDHLDKAAVKLLADKVGRFLVPLEVGKLMVKWGLPQEKISEFAWWQSATVGETEFVFTPTQHFSGRGLNDRNTTLWGSWVIRGQDKSIFFSGDSGYFGGFKQIGDRFGPFDLTLVETGAYSSLWSEVHMFPRESLQAHLDLKGKVMLPIHNSTFDLSLHRWYEPLEQVTKLARALNVTVTAPMIGERMAIAEPAPLEKWWLSTVNESEPTAATEPCLNTSN
ncbi:MBL fold metallo-hydrolase [Vibrio fluvialis]|nr:MBL fold metallo-hydrolase [Vibrio fluvialis]